jgi:hypothetical protein
MARQWGENRPQRTPHQKEGFTGRGIELERMNKICYSCKCSKPLDKFPKHKTNRDGISNLCKSCKSRRWRESVKLRAKTDPVIQMREKRRKHISHTRNRLRVKYGISPELFEDIWVESGGKCWICESTRKLCLDHDHVTGKPRGILCPKCNLGLGNFRDNENYLGRAIAYLARPR